MCFIYFIETWIVFVTLNFQREKMMKAYEFALDKVGLDVASGSIWSDYVNFIKVKM